ncbi:Insulin-degrading enzyme-like 1, peroxisomal, partial [Linum perenne]
QKKKIREMAVGTEEILKPRSDKREYRRILLTNSLQVLLISDPETDKAIQLFQASASMSVGVGAFSDPAGLEGLAHFLGALSFRPSSTCCFMLVRSTLWRIVILSTSASMEGKPMLSLLPSKPTTILMSMATVLKMLWTENQKNLLSDAWRMNQLQKHLSDEGHPYHKFSTGNWDTLEVKPKVKGLDTRQELIKFYEEHYSANITHLVIYAKESLDKLQGVVEEKFQAIQNHERSGFSFPGEPCSSEHLQILVRVVPISQGHKLRIVWPITPGILHYKEGPARYLGHLVGHEAEGSVFYVLKTLGWATGLYAGEGDSTKEFSFFEVAIDLTNAGHG